TEASGRAANRGVALKSRDFGALVAYLWLGERLTALRVIGILIGFAGVGAIVWGAVGAHAEGAARAVPSS
ncbi:MAG: hypothetical protein ACRETX_17670, partial [Steroidobacteraceae bacterium]